MYLSLGVWAAPVAVPYEATSDQFTYSLDHLRYLTYLTLFQIHSMFRNPTANIAIGVSILSVINYSLVEDCIFLPAVFQG